jgi:hypothetical protein
LVFDVKGKRSANPSSGTNSLHPLSIKNTVSTTRKGTIASIANPKENRARTPDSDYLWKMEVKNSGRFDEKLPANNYQNNSRDCMRRDTNERR